MKKARRAARELALNVLYQHDAAGIPLYEALETAIEHADLTRLGPADGGPAENARQYTRELVGGVDTNIVELDNIISTLSDGWPIERQPVVDRNVLRMALFEIVHREDIPSVVSIDEAVELAKKYSTEESGKFVNGVLAGYLKKYTSDNLEEAKGKGKNGSKDS